MHIPYEGEIERTDIVIPFDQIAAQAGKLPPPDKSAKIVLYCRSGAMSATAARALVGRLHERVEPGGRDDRVNAGGLPADSQEPMRPRRSRLTSAG